MFAEEAQCVVQWAFNENRNDSDCFCLTQEEPVEAFLEEFNLTEMMLGMLINNSLSTNLLEYFQYETLPAEYAAAILNQFPVVGGFSDVTAIVHGDVVCMLEIGDDLFVRAASASQTAGACKKSCVS